MTVYWLIIIKGWNKYKYVWNQNHSHLDILVLVFTILFGHCNTVMEFFCKDYTGITPWNNRRK